MKDKKEGKLVKSVSFQTLDPHEQELLDFALSRGTYFSTYVKRLIDADYREYKLNKK